MGWKDNPLRKRKGPVRDSGVKKTTFEQFVKDTRAAGEARRKAGLSSKLRSGTPRDSFEAKVQMGLQTNPTIVRTKQDPLPPARSSMAISPAAALKMAGGAPPVAPPPVVQQLPMPTGPPQGEAPEDQGLHDMLDLALQALGNAPDRNSYLQPYDMAEQRSQEAYKAALPVITSAYARLRDQLAARQGEAVTEFDQLRTDTAGRQAVLAEQLRSMQGRVAGDLGAQGAPIGGLQAEQGQQQANLTDAAMRQQRMQDTLAKIQAQSSNDRIEGTKGAETAAMANAGNNLNAILGQIGIQRAAAERQYANDAAQHGQNIAGTQLKFLEQQQANKQTQAKLLAEYAKEAKTAAVSPKKEFEAQKPDLRARYPKAMEYFDTVINEAKGDLSKALQFLDEDAEALKSGNNTWKRRFNVDTIRDWITRFYDDEKKVDPALMQQIQTLLG